MKKLLVLLLALGLTIPAYAQLSAPQQAQICTDLGNIRANNSTETKALADAKSLACPTPIPVPTPTPPPPVPTPTPTPVPVGGTSYVTPAQSLSAAIAALTPGSTLILRDGTYSGAITGVPSGSSGKPVTIQAENDGQAIITGGLNLAHTTAFVTVAGLHFKDTTGRTILGNHLKFQRDTFEGGCPSGNCVNVDIGSNDFSDTADILVEDSWAFGPGGRYNILVYNANRILLRRVVVRHDGGWTDSKGDPEAGITFYNCSNCAAQNSIVIDSNLTYHTWQSAFYGVQNSASPNSSNNNSWTGIIALNNLSGSDGASLRFDGDQAQAGHIIQNAILWGANWGLNASYAAPVSVTATQMTIGRNSGTSYGIGGGSGGAKSFSNVRLVNATLAGESATNTSTTLPTFLPQQLGGIGANVMTKVGVTGTLMNDPGWNTDTGLSLWPWPDQARLKTEMCAGVSRGFCADTSLTHYIFNYLGNGSPF